MLLPNMIQSCLMSLKIPSPPPPTCWTWWNGLTWPHVFNHLKNKEFNTEAHALFKDESLSLPGDLSMLNYFQSTYSSWCWVLGFLKYRKRSLTVEEQVLTLLTEHMHLKDPMQPLFLKSYSWGEWQASRVKQPLGRLTDTCLVTSIALSPPELKDLSHHVNKNEILNHIHELLITKAHNTTAQFWRTEVNKFCMASVNKCRLGGHSRDKGFPGGTSD